MRNPDAACRGATLALMAVLAVSFPGTARSLSAQTQDERAEQDRGGPAAADVHAVRATSPIRLDGHLDEPAWQAAPPIAGLRQVDPVEGAPVSQPTEARIVYDDQAIYVGVRLSDTAQVSTRLGRRDMDLADADWLGVGFDSYHDRRTAFFFDVNPSGVQRDEVKSVTRDGSEVDDNSWDAVWDVATSVDSAGWTAEYRIPFSQLRFSPAEEQVWGVQIERIIGRNHEYSVLSWTPKSERGGIPRYALLRGLRGIEPGKRLEVLPYVVARGDYTDPAGNPFRTGDDYTATGGVDLRYRVTSDLTLNASINPDFGQVEVDPAVVNLGVYETFFQEKRPFFVEGSEIFDFDTGGGGQLFYSRRIGRAPQLSAPTQLADVPDVTTILGAAKLSGKTESGWSLGTMEGLTSRETARYIAPSGDEASFAVEPLSNYLVLRARKDANAGRSAIGGMFTATNRDLATDALRTSLRSSAYAGGVDVRRESSDRSWVFQGSLAVTRVAGSPQSITAVQRASNHFFQRPDADYLGVDSAATSLTGLSTQVSVARQAGRHWQGGLQLGTITPGFEVNDLGYGYRTDRRDFQVTSSWQENQPGSFWRNWVLSGRARFEGNHANQLIANWFTGTAYFRHLNYWAIHLLGSYSLRAHDDRLTRGGPIAWRPANWQGQVYAATDARKPVTFEASAGASGDEFGGWTTTLNGGFGIKTSTRWSLTLSPEIDRGHVVAQYVTTLNDPGYTPTYGRRYVFAPLDQTTFSMETRFNMSFTPKLSLETYVQPFLSSASYGEPTFLTHGNSFDFQSYRGAQSVPDRDFNLRSLRGNAVLRWEWRPGSTLYVAWQQTRQDFAAGVDDFDFRRDRLALFRTAPDNIVVVKVNYWLNP